MRTKSSIFVLSSLCAVFSMSLSLGLRSQVEMSLERKTVRADLIVTGRVIELKTAWNEPKTRIYTFVSLSIEENIKGASPNKEITIRVPGGIIEGEIGTRVPGMPSFRKEERVLLFLIRDPRSDNFFVLNGVSGKYLIAEDDMVASEEMSLLAFLKEIKQLIPKNQ